MSIRQVTYTRQEPYKLMGTVRRPCLSVELEGNGRRTPPTLGIVDSGADRSAFHTDVATALLGLDLAALPTDQGMGTAGPHTVYVYTVTMHFQRRSFPARVLFNPSQPPQLALLGRADFFSHFLIGFDQKRHLLLYARA